jgi:hypothetical protein
MRFATHQDIARLAADQRPPCISIYVQTALAFPDSKHGRVRYRNLADQAAALIREKHSLHEKLVDQLSKLGEDRDFWEHRNRGLAVLASPDVFERFDLSKEPTERTFLGDAFYLVPLLEDIQAAHRFHILCLQRDKIRLYQGTRDSLAPLEPPGVPLTVTDALGEEVRVQRKEQAPAGKSAGEPRPAPRGPNAPPGHPATRDDAKLDAERFFRAVDHAVWEHLSRPAGLPLILVALPEHHAVFRSFSRNPQLLKAGVERSPAELSDQELRDLACQCMQSETLAREREILEGFKVALPRGLAAMDLRATSDAASQGRVSFLMIQANRIMTGPADSPKAGGEPPNGVLASELLNDVALDVLRRKGHVLVLPADRMPSDTGLAAAFRY